MARVAMMADFLNKDAVDRGVPGNEQKPADTHGSNLETRGSQSWVWDPGGLWRHCAGSMAGIWLAHQAGSSLRFAHLNQQGRLWSDL